MNTSKILNLVLALCLVVVLVKWQTHKGSTLPNDSVAKVNTPKTLLDNTYIGSLKLKNRFVRASVGDVTQQGTLNKQQTLSLYTQLAQGGVGTILTGYTIVDEAEKNQNIFAMYNDSFIKDYADLAQKVKQNGANILMQLVHLGSSYHSKQAPTHTVLGASAVPNIKTGITPKEMTQGEIKAMVDKFASAALRAKKAGFDGVEIHACHNYLLHQFATTHYNRRSDAYGGSLENRYRLTVEVYEAIRKAVGNDFQVWIKIQSQDGFDGGVSNEDCLYLCKTLAQKGIDAIEVSGNFWDFRGNKAFFKEIAAKISDETKTPVIVTGGNRDFEEMEKMLNETNIEYLGLARPLIQNPNIINQYIQSR
ncbi:MAG: NADH:flavin oxidoreductase [Bacteroidales bacterium]